jgi:predicted RNase H-like nuclease
VTDHARVTVVVAGLDACRTGWVAVVLEDGRFATAFVEATFTATLGRLDDAVAIGVDIPIGLPADGAGPRLADQAARGFVGPRRGSVFPTPPRAPLLAPSYADARRLLPSLSAQSYALRLKILEVDAALRELLEVDEALGDRIFEVHPEVSFAALAGRHLPHPKRTWNGLMERRRLLAGAGIELPDALPVDAPADDVLDAAVVAWTAHRKARGAAVALPADPPWQDGRAVAIWY